MCGGRHFSVRGSSALFDAAGSVFIFCGSKGEPTRVQHEKEPLTGRPLDEFHIDTADVDGQNGEPRWGLRVVHLDPEQVHKPGRREGPLRGVLGHHVPAPGGNGLAVSPLPCIGFGHTEDGDFVYYPPEDVPQKEELGEALGFKKGDPLCIRMWGIPIADAVAALDANGYPRFTEVTGADLRKIRAAVGALVSGRRSRD